ncbi:hypothetical protein CU048_08495 [Beijerinckiaceae bacterium]|nr:hypothetical protein CU048_08495 [Beijerinckiaceae bacterium]
MHFIQIASVLVAFAVGQFLNVLALVPIGLVSISLILGFSAWTKPGWLETFWGVVIVIVCLTFGYLFGALADFLSHFRETKTDIREPTDETIKNDWIQHFH